MGRRKEPERPVYQPTEEEKKAFIEYFWGEPVRIKGEFEILLFSKHVNILQGSLERLLSRSAINGDYRFNWKGELND